MGRRVYNWEKERVDSNVLRPLDENSIMGTPLDVTSIMTYSLPAEIMKDGRAVPGSAGVLTASDRAFARQVYPPNNSNVRTHAGGVGRVYQEKRAGFSALYECCSSPLTLAQAMLAVQGVCTCECITQSTEGTCSIPCMRYLPNQGREHAQWHDFVGFDDRACMLQLSWIQM
jgi:hypothetical protein